MRSHGVVRAQTKKIKRVYVIPLEDKNNITIIKEAPIQQPIYQQIQSNYELVQKGSMIHIINRQIKEPQKISQFSISFSEQNNKQYKRLKKQSKPKSQRKAVINHRHKIFELMKHNYNKNVEQLQKQELNLIQSRSEIVNKRNINEIRKKKKIFDGQEYKINIIGPSSPIRLLQQSVIKLQTEHLQIQQQKKYGNLLNKYSRSDQIRIKAEGNKQKQYFFYKNKYANKMDQRKSKADKKSNTQRNHIFVPYNNKYNHEIIPISNQKNKGIINQVSKLAQSFLKLQVNIIRYPKCLPQIYCKHH